MYFQWDQSYGDLRVCLAGFRLWKSGVKASSSGNIVTEIWTKVLVQQEQSYRDLDQSLRSEGTKLQRSKCSPGGI